MFTADAYGLYPPQLTTSGTVQINVRSFDGSSTGNMTYQQQIPAGMTHSGFLGFVPIPNGVGSLWYNRGSHAVVTPSGYNPLSMLSAGWDTFITLVSSQWNSNTQTWNTTTVTKQLPAIIPMGYRFCGMAGCTKDVLINTSPYMQPIYFPVQYGPNKSWLLLEGEIAAYSTGALFPNTGYWGMIEINNGQLIVSAGSIPYPPSIQAADYPVAVPTGSYSLVHTALTKGNGLRLFSYIEGTGRLTLNGWLGLGIAFRLVPAVPAYTTATNSKWSGDFIVDQLIIGGSSMYTLGQGVRSAPGYYQMKILAGVVKGQVSNAAGQMHPSQTVQNILNGAIIVNPRDATFFQWQ